MAVLQQDLDAPVTRELTVDPSPEEIARQSQLIRLAWNETTQRTRRQRTPSAANSPPKNGVRARATMSKVALSNGRHVRDPKHRTGE